MQITKKMTETSLLLSACKHQQNGQWTDAISLYKDVLKAQPHNLQALFGIAEIAQKLNQNDTALSLFSQIINFNPHYLKAYQCRGYLLRTLGNPEGAIADFSAAIALDGSAADIFNSRGIAHCQMQNFDEAIADFSQAINRNKNFADAFYNRALAYCKINDFARSIDDYTSTISLKPDHFQAFNNRGIANREAGQIEKASADLLKSSEINPDFHDGYWNASLCLLMSGDYEKGWPLYEHRWSSTGFTSRPRNFSAPLWLGKDTIKGKTILLHSEQGLGDSLQFCRYVPLVENLGCHIILEVEKPLMNIMRSLSNSIEIIEKDTALPHFDYHCPLMSLPLAFKTTLKTIPHETPYLRVNKDRVAWWRTKLGPKKRPRIGLVWRGNPNHPNDQKRSIQLHDIIHKLPNGLDWISLHKDIFDDEEKLINASKKIIHFGETIDDFADIGALCEALDAILCVDTSIAHLGGALGLPVHVLLPYVPDFRWLSGRADSPWYPSLRLYRQGPERSWAEPMQDVTLPI